MPAKTVLLCDDVFAEKKEAKQRSHLLQKVAQDFARLLKCNLRTITVLDIPKKIVSSKNKKEDSVETIYGRPVDVILKESKDPGVEMLILGTRPRSGLKRTFLGSVAEEVVRNAQVPVMVLGSHAVDSDYSLKSKKQRILVVTDLSDFSGGAERLAAKLAKRINAEVLLYHSVGDQIKHMKDMLYSQRVNSPGLEQIFDEMKSFAEESLAKKIKAYEGQGISATGHIGYEEAEVSKILRKNNWHKADLIVMGTHSRGKFLKAFLGSTTRRVMLSAPVPVIIVRSR
ncbi:universal stress protein [Bdellovibrio sp. SKB1291214]|uniref:universal stress protein n=1 Tax=Bdellovibrio sp. SKB1291214 TaxID=1732569 RepID=UPI000B51B7DA|nr:universal stress protein [Bdellovibrio sp. SKB1291214]UYL07446.1 universal stress protein [Bdellovibrio sp. SKB1291214]